MIMAAGHPDHGLFGTEPQLKMYDPSGSVFPTLFFPMRSRAILSSYSQAILQSSPHTEIRQGTLVSFSMFDDNQAGGPTVHTAACTFPKGLGGMAHWWRNGLSLGG